MSPVLRYTASHQQYELHLLIALFLMFRVAAVVLTHIIIQSLSNGPFVVTSHYSEILHFNN